MDDQAVQEEPLYTTLTQEPFQIRLIRIEPPSNASSIICSMQIFTHETAPPYKALSYAWGDHTDSHSIILNNHSINIRRNLHAFLRVFTQQPDCPNTWLWIDALSINQSDVSERNFQVQRMDTIFRGSAETFAWLGEDPHHGAAVSTLQRIKLEVDTYRVSRDVTMDESTACLHVMSSNPNILHPADIQALRHIYGRPYWRRHWIVQELLLSGQRARTVLYGVNSIPFHLICNVTGSLPLTQDETLTRASSFAASLVSLDDAFNTYDEDKIWLACTNVASKSSCSDLRDKIYGIQSLFPPYLRVRVDYKNTPRHVLEDAMWHWVGKLTGYRYADDHAFIEGCTRLAVAMGLTVDWEGLREAVSDHRTGKDMLAEDVRAAALVSMLEMHFLESDDGAADHRV